MLTDYFNYIPFLFQNSSPSRIVIITDKSYANGKINISDLNSDHNYNKCDAYNQSKLANLLFMRELIKKLKGTGVTVNAVEPGKVDTEIYRYMWFYNGFFWPFIWPFLKSSPAGAQTTLHVALKRGLKKKSGLYYR